MAPLRFTLALVGHRYALEVSAESVEGPGPSPQPRATFLSRSTVLSECSLAAVHLLRPSRAAAIVQAGPPAVVHGHSNMASHWVCRCRSRPGQDDFQLVRRVQPSNSGALSNQQPVRSLKPRHAPNTLASSCAFSPYSPYSHVGASIICKDLGMQISAVEPDALRAAQSQQHVDERASVAARRTAGTYRSIPERSALAACSMRDASWPMLGHEPYGCRRAHSLSRLAAVFASLGPSGRRSFRPAPRGVPWAPHGRKNRCAIDA